jgi:circadian clock protein KaiC
MLGGKGFYRGSSILVSGCAGTGKSSLAASLVQATCRRGKRALYLASEQSTDEVIRNRRSIGVDLEPCLKRGLLHFYASRPGTFGLEKHLVAIHDLTARFRPKVVVIDPITNFASVGTYSEVKSMVTRMIDMFKSQQITTFFTSLTSGDSSPELSEVGVSSQMDTWLLLRNLECNGERNRGLYVLKSRGMANSNQIREFVLTDHGIELLDVYVGPAGLLTGSARIAQAAREKAEAEERGQLLERKSFELEEKRLQLKAKIRALRSEFGLEEQALQRDLQELQRKGKQMEMDRREMGRARKADVNPSNDSLSYGRTS